ASVSNGVSLTVSTKPDFDASEPDDVDLHRFRAVQIPAGKFPPGTPQVDVVWGLGPVNASLSPPGDLSLPTSWADTTMVEVWLNGMNNVVMSPPVPYGEWRKIATVSIAGGQIETKLPMIGMVGLKKL